MELLSIDLLGSQNSFKVPAHLTGIGSFGLLAPYQDVAYANVILFHNVRWLINYTPVVNVWASWSPFLPHLLVVLKLLYIVLSGRNPRLRLLCEAVPCGGDVGFIDVGA